MTASRILNRKNKGFTLLNIIGLAIGMGAAMLILLWINFQWSIDRGYPKTDRLYVVGQKEFSTNNELAVWFSTPKPMAAVMKAEIAGVENLSRLSGINGLLFSVGETKILSKVGSFVDSSFLQLFDLPLLAGNPSTALRDPSQVVLTEKLAISLFGTSDVLGKTVQLDSTQQLLVSGVLKEVPKSSRFTGYEYFLPWTLMEKMGYSDEHWGNSSVNLFVEMKEQANIAAAQAQLKDLIKRHSEVSTQSFLKPIKESYLYNTYKNGQQVGGRISMVKTFSYIAGFILLIACINFMNLSTAQSEKRAKEVGIRKVVGAPRFRLIGLFLRESLQLTAIAGLLALLLVMLFLPVFVGIVGQEVNIPYLDIRFWALFVGFIVFTGLLAGSYPAFFLSSFNPIRVLKGRFQQLHSKFNPRKFLVVTQFCIAIVLIISTVAIRKQIQHAQDRDFGFTQDNLVYMMEVGDMKRNYPLIKHALLERGIAQSVTRMMSPLTERWSGWNGFTWAGKDPNEVIQINRQSADDQVVATAGFTLLQGRDLDLAKFPTDSMAAIINETAAKAMGFKDPLGKTFNDGNDQYHIIGVIKDFIQESPFEPIKPLVIEGANGFMNTYHIRFNPELSTEEALKKTEQVFKEYNSAYPFQYQFVDEAYAFKFMETQRTGTLASLFAGLTIFISCLGLFGLAAFMAESRIKEIGIRKVLGASVFSVTRMLSKEFLLLVSLACLIAFPIAYWIMDQYLAHFSYRITLSWDIFLLAGAGAIMISMLTVSFQSIKAALANPVDSLRNE